MISFREFMMIFRKAAAGELKEDSGLGVLAKQFEIDVDEVGVEGAKTFFEAKVIILMIDLLIAIILFWPLLVNMIGYMTLVFADCCY